MPDVLLFGATGYTGRLTAEALARRDADFAIAGRSKEKLDTLASRVHPSDVRVAEVGDVDGLVRALSDVKVLCTTVGPFTQLGMTAVEAALRAGVNYLDSTGEAGFIQSLLEIDHRARDAGIALAPAMGFDEVPSDVAVTLAAEGLERPDVIVTVAFPSQGSSGTMKTILTNIAGETGRFIENGVPVPARSGAESRWAPMPPPLGPKDSISFPLAETLLAPLHVELGSFKTFLTVGTPQKLAIRYGTTLLRLGRRLPGTEALINRVLPSGRGPDAAARREGFFTVLAEARSGAEWRNIAIQGTDVYGLTGELLAAGALRMAEDGYSETGVVAPVQAMGLDVLQKELIDLGCSIDTYSYER